jgi:hypothetical protein
MSAMKTSDLIGLSPGGRKLIAVVYADMVGYSRLIALDDVGTIERLRALRRIVIDPAIDAHGGQIVQTGGDSLLITFDSNEALSPPIQAGARAAACASQSPPRVHPDRCAIRQHDLDPTRRLGSRVGQQLRNHRRRFDGSFLAHVLRRSHRLYLDAGKSPRGVHHGFRLRRQQRVSPCIEPPAADAVLARHLCRRCARRQALCRNRLLLLNRIVSQSVV